jgi:hypothetical protein
MYLERPYGLAGRQGASSGIGELSGSPYTVAEEEKISVFTPAACIASASTQLPWTLFW